MIWTWLAACFPAYPPVTTVDGLQVVAIVTTPAQPSEFDALEVEVWVADGIGLGAEVLVWMCTPLGDRCIEFDALQQVGGDGMPLGLVARTGPADPVFRATTGWPFLQGFGASVVAAPPGPWIEDDDVVGASGIIVWALACIPGACDVMRQVRADPVVGSDTWWDATNAMSAPDQLLEGLPPGEASLAVKFVPTWQGPDEFGYYQFANRAPDLQLESMPAAPWLPVTLSFVEPDADDVDFQAFITDGRVSVTQSAPSAGTVEVDASPGPTGQIGDVFLVGEDGRGGSVVWSNLAGDQGCDPAIGLPQGPDPGQTFPLTGTFLEVGIEGFDQDATLTVVVQAEDGEELISTTVGCGPRSCDAIYNYGYYGYSYYSSGYTTAETPFDRCERRSGAPFLPVPANACAWSGHPLTLTVTVWDSSRRVTKVVPVVGQAHAYCR